MMIMTIVILVVKIAVSRKASLAPVMWRVVLQVAVQSLWNMRLAVFVKPEHEGRVNHMSTASVRTGLGNTLGGFNPCNVSRHPG